MDYPFDYSVIIPVYNSTESLKELTVRLKKVFEEMQVCYEIIFVDDCSPNTETWPALEALRQKHAEVKTIQLMRNFGKPGAVFCGFSYAKGRHVIMMDDDLQHLPEEVPLLAEKQQHDIVIGAFPQKKHSGFKRITSNMKNWLDYKLINKPKHIRNSAFKLMKQEVVQAITQFNITYPYISALLFFASHDIVNVELTHGQRKYGKTGYTLKKMLKQFSNFIFNNSSVLLKGVATIGILFSAISFVMIIFYLYRSLFVGINVPGWTSTIIILLFIGGLILFTLGVLGEYFIRLINGIENRPAYLIRHLNIKTHDNPTATKEE